MKAIHHKLGLLAICAGALTLVACGGDSATVPLTVSGKVATGLAIPNGTVTVQCTSGAGGPVSTNSSGFYTIDMANATGPCLVKVVYQDGLINRTLYSMSATTNTGEAVANVTPVSDAIVKSLAAAKGAPTVDSLVNNPDYKPSDENIGDAVASALIQINLSLPPDKQIPSNTNLLGNRDFTPATPGVASSDPLDNALDILAPSGVLDPDLIADISTSVNTVVDPNATGGF